MKNESVVRSEPSDGLSIGQYASRVARRRCVKRTLPFGWIDAASVVIDARPSGRWRTDSCWTSGSSVKSLVRRRRCCACRGSCVPRKYVSLGSRSIRCRGVSSSQTPQKHGALERRAERPGRDRCRSACRRRDRVLSPPKPTNVNVRSVVANFAEQVAGEDAVVVNGREVFGLLGASRIDRVELATAELRVVRERQRVVEVVQPSSEWLGVIWPVSLPSQRVFSLIGVDRACPARLRAGSAPVPRCSA